MDCVGWPIDHQMVSASVKRPFQCCDNKLDEAFLAIFRQLFMEAFWYTMVQKFCSSTRSFVLIVATCPSGKHFRLPQWVTNAMGRKICNSNDYVGNSVDCIGADRSCFVSIWSKQQSAERHSWSLPKAYDFCRLIDYQVRSDAFSPDSRHFVMEINIIFVRLFKFRHDLWFGALSTIVARCLTTNAW